MIARSRAVHRRAFASGDVLTVGADGRRVSRVVPPRRMRLRMRIGVGMMRAGIRRGIRARRYSGADARRPGRGFPGLDARLRLRPPPRDEPAVRERVERRRRRGWVSSPRRGARERRERGFALRDAVEEQRQGLVGGVRALEQRSDEIDRGLPREDVLVRGRGARGHDLVVLRVGGGGGKREEARG